MSRATKRHANRRAKKMTDEELREEIERLGKTDHLPTHEFDDKRALHKRKVRKDVYEER